MLRNVFINIIRLGFLVLVSFEVLGLTRIVQVDSPYSWLGFIITGCFIWLSLEIVSSRLKKSGLEQLSPAMYLIGLIGSYLNLFGILTGLFTRYGWYDQVIHGFGGAAAALVFCSVFSKLQIARKISVGPRLLGFFTFCSTMLLSSLYTTEEFLETKIFHDGRMGSGIIGGFHADNHFLWNAIGAALVAFVSAVVIRRRENSLSYSKKSLSLRRGSSQLTRDPVKS